MNLTGIQSLLIFCLSVFSQEAQLLAPGQPIIREMTGGQTHTYRLKLAAGQFVHLIADQRNADVALQISDATGKTIAESDLLNYGSLEALSLESPAEGEYRVTVKAIHPPGLTGAYELRTELRNSATAEDKKRMEAERLMNEGKKLRGPAAAEKHQQALALWRELGDEYWLTRSLILFGEANRVIGNIDKAGQSADESLELARKNRDRVGEAGSLRLKSIVASMTAQYSKSIELCEQELALRAAMKDRVNEARIYSNLGINYIQIAQYPKAIEYYDRAIAIHRELKDPASERIPLHNSGDVYNQMGKFDLAAERFEQAIAAHRAAKDSFAEASSLDSLGFTHAYRGDREKATENFEQALAIRREIRDRNGEAGSLINLAMIAVQYGQFEKAIATLGQALPITREVKSRINEARAVLMTAQAYFGISQFDKAEEYGKQALALNREVRNPINEANALSSLGNVYSILGLYEQALENYHQSLETYRAAKARTFEAASLINLGITYTYLNQNDKAIETLNQALALQRELKSTAAIGYTLNNLGNAYRSSGDNEKAIKYYEEALPLMRERRNQSGESAVVSNLANCHHFLGQYEKAREYGEQALALSREIKERAVEARTLATLGNSYRGLGRRTEAAQALQQSIAINREINNPFNEGYGHYVLALLEQDKANLKAALAEIEEAIKLNESLRSNLLSADLRLSFFAQAQDLYRLQIELLEELGQANPNQDFSARALEAGERARARSLLEMLSESRAEIRQGVDVKLLDRERLLASQITAKAQKLQQVLSPEQRATTRQELSALETEYQLTQAEIRKTSPAYAALTQPQPLKLAEMQAQLDPDTLLLQYSLGERRSYLWVVGKSSLKSYELPKRAEIEEAARRIYNLLSERGRSIKGETPQMQSARIAKFDAELPVAAQELSQMALGPLAGSLKSQRLAIVADGALQYVPFGMLPAPSQGMGVGSREMGKKRASSQLPTPNSQPLIVDHEIITLPSASTLAVQRRELAARTPAPKLVAVIADPVFSENDQRFKALAQKKAEQPTTAIQESSAPALNDLVATRSIKHLAEEGDGTSNIRTLVIPALPFTRIEAQQIIAAAPGTDNLEALDFKANRAAALNPELSQYRYVHFATHGYLDSERPGLSALLLSMFDENGKPQDGFLRVNDIYNLKLQAELVVLSACQTGLGKEVKGEGVVGLTRGFMYAGAPRVVVSLWNVNDRATSDLMSKFYQKMLKEKQRPAAALRSAQLEMLKNPQWRSPYYWAAFGLQGEWR